MVKVVSQWLLGLVLEGLVQRLANVGFDLAVRYPHYLQAGYISFLTVALVMPGANARAPFSVGGPVVARQLLLPAVAIVLAIVLSVLRHSGVSGSHWRDSCILHLALRTLLLMGGKTLTGLVPSRNNLTWVDIRRSDWFEFVHLGLLLLDLMMVRILRLRTHEHLAAELVGEGLLALAAAGAAVHVVRRSLVALAALLLVQLDVHLLAMHYLGLPAFDVLLAYSCEGRLVNLLADFRYLRIVDFDYLDDRTRAPLFHCYNN